MKFYTALLLSILLVAASAEPVIKTLTLREISVAMETKKVAPSDKQAYSIALNKIMYASFTGENAETVQAAICSPSGNLEWTMSEMNESLSNPNTDKQTHIFIKMARDTMLQMNQNGMNRKSMAITLPALDISTWTRDDLLAVINDPITTPDLQGLLKTALSDLDKANASGIKTSTINLVTTVGIIPNKNPRFIQAPKFKN